MLFVHKLTETFHIIQCLYDIIIVPSYNRKKSLIVTVSIVTHVAQFVTARMARDISGVDLYYGDACMLIHDCQWSEPQ